MKKRFYEYNLLSSFLPHGARNTIADVHGVTVGHTTKIEGTDVRTGVTVIDPGIDNLFANKLPAAIAIGNGSGKIAGTTQIEELGTLEAPIGIASTHAVGIVTQALIDIVVGEQKKLEPLQSVNTFVGESNDGRLNNIHIPTLTPEDVQKAYAARTGDFELGNVGAGTGMRAFAWKGGIGSSSRIVRIGGSPYTVGILVQTNFGGSLSLGGVPIGKLMQQHDFTDFIDSSGDGSCMTVIATDAPLTARQLKRMARRAFLGMARTGAIVAHASGDYALSFTTSREGIEGSGSTGKCLPDDVLNAFFLAVVEGTEEAIFDAMFAAETMQGYTGRILEALSPETILEHIKAYRHGS